MMKTLTINVPDSVDPAEARWEVARALFEKGTLTLDQAASLAELAPTYFRLRLEGFPIGLNPSVTYSPVEPFNPDKIRQLADQMDIQESWEELVAQIGK